MFHFDSVADTATQKLQPFRGIKREQECSSGRVNLFAVNAKETYAQALCFKIFSLFYFPYQLKKKYKNDLALALNISAISFNLPACAGCTESNRVANSKDSKQSRENSRNLLMILRVESEKYYWPFDLTTSFGHEHARRLGILRNKKLRRLWETHSIQFWLVAKNVARFICELITYVATG